MNALLTGPQDHRPPDHGPETTDHRPAAAPSRITHHASRTPSSSFVIRHSSFLLAFSLLEILVTIALLTLIILGLFSMFAMVQKAFKSSLTQVDVLESGRAFMDMLPREIEQAAPSGRRNTVNFFTQIVNSSPLFQYLPGSTDPANPTKRLNVLEDLFMLRRENQIWVGTGYFVRTNDPTSGGLLYLPETHTGNPGKLGAGTLYRFTASTTNFYQDPGDLFTAFDRARKQGGIRLTNVNRIADGVIHFRFRAFDTNGTLITRNISTNQFNSQIQTALAPYPISEVRQYSFFSNAVPAAVEVELAMLEQGNWQRYKAIANSDAQYNYLSNHASQVHMFRQRIPIACVDPKAYQP